jgi:hypothetical protein
MARHKPHWRRLLTARHLRWLALRLAVAVVPGFDRRLAFFPKALDMVAAAEAVLEDGLGPAEPPLSAAERAFVGRCAPNDSVAPDFRPDDPPATGRRTVLCRQVWLDAETGGVLLPGRRATVLARGERVNWNLARPHWRRRIEPVEGAATVLLPTANHYHMLVDNGLRLLHLADRPEAAAGLTVVALPPRGPAQAILHAALGRLAPVRLHTVAPGTIVAAGTALIDFPSPRNYEWPPIGRGAADRLRGLIEAAAPPPALAAGPRLYLDRGASKLRRVANAEALGALLGDAGFEPFTATADNLPEQVARFAAARTVVAVHGAGLANLLFCPPGCRVIEIFPANFVKSTYWWMARRLGLAHMAVIGGPGDYDQRFTVPLDAVAAALEGA